jgi:hypothetical protein
MAPSLSTGGVVEPVPVPLDSFPPVTPQPNLSASREPQLDAVSPIPNLEGLKDDEAVDVIAEWFFSNFEDPVQGTPRNDGEFQYVWGGPYDARDQIGDAFSDQVSEDVIDAAVRAVEAEGTLEWAPHGKRVQPDFDEPASSATSNSRALHAEMLSRIVALEREMAQLPKPRRGIGDNNPPEPIEAEPFTDRDRKAVERALAVLKAQPPAPTAQPTDALKAAQFLTTLGKKLRVAAESFASEAVKSAGSEFGKRAIQSPLWLTIITKLQAVADAAIHWLNSLGSPF